MKVLRSVSAWTKKITLQLTQCCPVSEAGPRERRDAGDHGVRHRDAHQVGSDRRTSGPRHIATSAPPHNKDGEGLFTRDRPALPPAVQADLPPEDAVRPAAHAPQLGPRVPRGHELTPAHTAAPVPCPTLQRQPPVDQIQQEKQPRTGQASNSPLRLRW